MYSQTIPEVQINNFNYKLVVNYLFRYQNQICSSSLPFNYVFSFILNIKITLGAENENPNINVIMIPLLLGFTYTLVISTTYDVGK